jgi:hypothetical protein
MSDDSSADMYFRAANREAAKDHVRRTFPGATSWWATTSPFITKDDVQR